VPLDLAELAAGYCETSPYFNMYGNDQRFLAEALWPRIREDAVIHDTFYDVARTGPFPGKWSWSEDTHAGRCHKDREAVREEARLHGIITV
jgi:hypothetical protein